MPRTPIVWCRAGTYQTEAWCQYGDDPAGPVTDDSSVLVWWTDDAAAAGKRVVLAANATEPPFAESDVLAASA